MGFGLGSVTNAMSHPSSAMGSFNPFHDSPFNIPNPLEDATALLSSTLGSVMAPFNALAGGLSGILPILVIGAVGIGGVMILKK